MKKWVILALLFALPLFADGEKRNYFAKLTPQEAKDIQYIVSTLGNTSQVGLLFKKKSLEQAGDRLGQVHPLRFFGYVMSNQQLKASFASIHGMAWRNFENGMAGSLQKAFQRNNLNQEIINDFAKSSHLDSKRIEGFVKNKQWKKLIDFVRSQA